jgi:hypothetical protein
MKVKELIDELQRFPADTDVEIYAGKCCNVQPIHQVYFNPGGKESPVVVLVDETEQPCLPGRCNCS